MKSRILVGVLALGTIFGAMALAPHAPNTPAPAPAPAAYTIDGVHSFVVFRCKHNNAAYAYGMFSKIFGSLNFDESAPESSSLTAEVGTASVSTGQDKRDNHLKSGDFFGAEEFPKATFKSKSFKKSGENTFDVVGDFTLRGVTKEVTVKLEKTGQAKDGRSGKDLIGFEGVFTINRMDYGVKYGAGALGNDVRITFSVEAGKN